MSTVFRQLDETLVTIREMLSGYQPVDEGHRFPWENAVYTDKAFRRAHLDVVDVRDTRKLFMAHLCVFPNTNDPSPLFGFDLIAGPNKVTGAFHDFSPLGGNTFLDGWFEAAVEQFKPTKERTLPDWARPIFSKSMVAATNIQNDIELAEFLSLVVSNLKFYLEHIGTATADDFTEQQNRYCRNQKMNPHTPRVMEALGYDAETVRHFIDTCLFPEVKSHEPMVRSYRIGEIA
jgi:Ferredoxin-dependent bilin reductase